MKDIAIYGAGGFGKEIACIIKRINSVNPTWNLIGYYDDGVAKGTETTYGPVLGGIDDLNNRKEDICVAMAIGNPVIVKTIVEKIENPHVDFPNIIDPDVIFLDKDDINLGEGNVMMMKCTISCQVRIGNFNLFNIGIGVGHDAILGNYHVFMPNVNISGGVVIGDTNLFGVKSSVLQYLKVGSNSKIGAHCLMMRNVKSDSLYFGIPGERK